MERPALDDWMKRSAEVLAEVEKTLKVNKTNEEDHRKEVAPVVGKLVVPDIAGKDL